MRPQRVEVPQDDVDVALATFPGEDHQRLRVAVDRDVEYLATAIDDAFSGRRSIEEGMADYQSQRDEIAEPLYELTTQLVSGEPPQPAQFLAFGLAMQKMMPEETANAAS